jgi:hypothetical protein
MRSGLGINLILLDRERNYSKIYNNNIACQAGPEPLVGALIGRGCIYPSDFFFA